MPRHDTRQPAKERREPGCGPSVFTVGDEEIHGLYMFVGLTNLP